jgi:hypothetical protein
MKNILLVLTTFIVFSAPIAYADTASTTSASTTTASHWHFPKSIHDMDRGKNHGRDNSQKDDDRDNSARFGGKAKGRDHQCSTTTTPLPDKLGPTITDLSISPTSGPAGTIFTFTVTADDPSGLVNVIYDIKYPDSPVFDTPYFLHPNCNFSGEKQGTCTFSQAIDIASSPAILGQYTVASIRATDTQGNTSTYFPNGTVTNGNENTHTLNIPAITIHG